MPTEGVGLYPLGSAAVLNTEISSTYEGRHLTFLEADITGHENAFPTKGHPVVISDAAPNDHGDIVGVVLAITRTDGSIGAAANSVTDLIAIDTEGIWYLSVSANVGEGEVRHGDKLFINRSSALISNDDNKNTNAHFGYALGGVADTEVATIAVKVHWDPSDPEEKVGAKVGEVVTPYVNDRANVKFREYYYSAGGGGVIEGERMELAPTAPCVTACVDYRRLVLDQTQDIVTGRSSVFEARIDVLAGAVSPSEMACAVLDFKNLCTANVNSWQAAYIAFRDRSPGGPGVDQLNTLFNFMDIDPTAEAASNWKLFCLHGSWAATHSIRIVCEGHPFWIGVSTTVPT